MSCSQEMLSRACQQATHAGGLTRPDDMERITFLAKMRNMATAPMQQVRFASLAREMSPMNDQQGRTKLLSWAGNGTRLGDNCQVV